MVPSGRAQRWGWGKWDFKGKTPQEELHEGSAGGSGSSDGKGGAVGAGRGRPGQAAGPSTGKTVHSKKLNKSSSQSDKGWEVLGLTEERALASLQGGLCGERAIAGTRAPGERFSRLLISQGAWGLDQDEDLGPPAPRALHPLCPSKAIKPLESPEPQGCSEHQPQARPGQQKFP